MASKRARAPRSTSQPIVPAIERDEDFPDVVFCNEDHRRKFQQLKGRIVSSKWIDHSALERLAFPAESSGARTGPPLGPSPVAPQGYSPFEQLMIDNFNDMRLSQQQMATQLTSLDTRFTHFELQSQAAFRPLLDYHHQQGHFHADVQYPYWYSPPPTYQDDDDDDEQQDNDFDPMG